MSIDNSCIRVLLFGEIQALCGGSESIAIPIDRLQGITTAGALWVELVRACEKHAVQADRVQVVLKSSALAVNEEFVDGPETPVDILKDTIAIIPPISGG